MTRYEVGQRVWIFDINSRKNGPAEGKVAKVGRTLVHVEHGNTWGGPQKFYIDGGYANGDFSHQWIKTDEQRALDERRETAVTVMGGFGLKQDYRCHLTVEQLESIAAICAASSPSPTEPGAL